MSDLVSAFLAGYGIKHNHVCVDVRGGTTRQLLAYLRAQLRRCVPYNRMKLMVVGLQVCT